MEDVAKDKQFWKILEYISCNAYLEYSKAYILRVLNWDIWVGGIISKFLDFQILDVP